MLHPNLPILFADDRFVVLNKPPGLPVHPGPSGGPSVEDWFPLLSRRKSGPWLAHRLDADTSGCLVVALRRPALHAAQAAFAAGQARKEYWAVVTGRPEGEGGTIDAPLLKRTTRTGWRMVIDPTGQPAITTWRLAAHANGQSWLILWPRTGRTHQIRVHCAALGCPILGDPIYGPPIPGTPIPGAAPSPLHLLARTITLPLTPPLTATAPPPPHMHPLPQQPGNKPEPKLS